MLRSVKVLLAVKWNGKVFNIHSPHTIHSNLTVPAIVTVKFNKLPLDIDNNTNLVPCVSAISGNVAAHLNHCDAIQFNSNLKVSVFVFEFYGIYNLISAQFGCILDYMCSFVQPFICQYMFSTFKCPTVGITVRGTFFLMKSSCKEFFVFQIYVHERHIHLII